MPGFARADSNGCAAGNCVEEAALQGLLELVERDAVAIWWFNAVRMPAAEMASFASDYVSAWIARYESLGCRVWALDITADIAVPVFAAIAAGPDGRVIYGFGAHADPEIALVRALTGGATERAEALLAEQLIQQIEDRGIAVDDGDQWRRHSSPRCAHGRTGSCRASADCAGQWATRS